MYPSTLLQSRTEYSNVTFVSNFLSHRRKLQREPQILLVQLAKCAMCFHRLPQSNLHRPSPRRTLWYQNSDPRLLVPNEDQQIVKRSQHNKQSRKKKIMIDLQVLPRSVDVDRWLYRASDTASSVPVLRRDFSILENSRISLV